MTDVDLFHEQRVSKQARETSKHSADRIWLSQTGPHAKTYKSDFCRIVAFSRPLSFYREVAFLAFSVLVACIIIVRGLMALSDYEVL